MKQRRPMFLDTASRSSSRRNCNTHRRRLSKESFCNLPPGAHLVETLCATRVQGQRPLPDFQFAQRSQHEIKNNEITKAVTHSSSLQLTPTENDNTRMVYTIICLELSGFERQHWGCCQGRRESNWADPPTNNRRTTSADRALDHLKNRFDKWWVHGSVSALEIQISKSR